MSDPNTPETKRSHEIARERELRVFAEIVRRVVREEIAPFAARIEALERSKGAA